jgi:hypothetical protein
MELPQGEERKMKKKREDEERERGTVKLFVGQSHQFIRRNWSRTCQMVRLAWCDLANLTKVVTLWSLVAPCVLV